MQGRHKKQTGGHGQFGDCWIRMEPLPRGGKFEFANEIFGGSIPQQVHSGGGKGHHRSGREKGIWQGSRWWTFKVTVYDGSYHDVDSSEMAFKLAARKAFKAAMEEAKPTLLEPIMNVEVQAPVEYAGDLMGDMNGRRGRISGMDTKGGHADHSRDGPHVRNAELSERPDLDDSGARVLRMEFDHYDFVPQLQAEKIIAAAKSRQDRRRGRRGVVSWRTLQHPRPAARVPQEPVTWLAFVGQAFSLRRLFKPPGRLQIGRRIQSCPTRNQPVPVWVTGEPDCRDAAPYERGTLFDPGHSGRAIGSGSSPFTQWCGSLQPDGEHGPGFRAPFNGYSRRQVDSNPKSTFSFARSGRC